MIRDNPAMAFRQYREPPRRSVWTHAEEARFLQICGPELELVYMLAIYTAQRRGDLLALPWSAYQDGSIRMQQGKTGKWLDIPVIARLARKLAETPRVSPIICTRNGRPWTPYHFSHTFRKTTVKARIEGRAAYQRALAAEGLQQFYDRDFYEVPEG